MSSAPEDDQRSEIKLRRKLDGWRKAVERQGAETGKLVVYEWVVEPAAGDFWDEQRSPAGSRQVCRLNEWESWSRAWSYILVRF